MSEPLETLICYRLERAQESLADARLLADAASWNTCVNRLYYSCFYAVSALLARDGLSASRHTGIRSLFNRNYVRTGGVPRDATRLYNDLFERRQESDYADFVRFQADQVRPWIPQTAAYARSMGAMALTRSNTVSTVTCTALRALLLLRMVPTEHLLRGASSSGVLASALPALVSSPPAARARR